VVVRVTRIYLATARWLAAVLCCCISPEVDMPNVQHKRGTAAALTATNPVLAFGELAFETDTGKSKFGDGTTAWTGLGYFVPSASDIVAGTLTDSRLSSSVILSAALAQSQQQTTSVVDAFDRRLVNTTQNLISGAIYWSFFTAAWTATVTQISMASGGSASALSLARMGLYTAAAPGNATLVARTASDNTLFTAAALFTRSFATAGGYPDSYTLNAGSRYAVAMMLVSGGNPGVMRGAACPADIAPLTPRVQGVRTGTSDLVTSQGSGQYNGTIGSALWARLS
jgi:hypothetical protein